MRVLAGNVHDDRGTLLSRVGCDGLDQSQAGRDCEARAANRRSLRGRYDAATAERGQLIDADALGCDAWAENYRRPVDCDAGTEIKRGCAIKVGVLAEDVDGQV